MYQIIDTRKHSVVAEFRTYDEAREGYRLLVEFHGLHFRIQFNEGARP